MKKSVFTVIAEAIQSGKLADVDLPTENIDRRKLTIDEIKEFITEEFEDAKSAEDAADEAEEKAWHKAEVENEIDFIKALNIKEFFKK